MGAVDSAVIADTIRVLQSARPPSVTYRSVWPTCARLALQRAWQHALACNNDRSSVYSSPNVDRCIVALGAHVLHFTSLACMLHIRLCRQHPALIATCVRRASQCAIHCIYSTVTTQAQYFACVPALLPWQVTWSCWQQNVAAAQQQQQQHWRQ